MNETTRIIPHAHAKEISLRLIAGSFRRDGERLPLGKRPNFSIPTRVNDDDDCLIVAYIEQQQRVSEAQIVVGAAAMVRLGQAHRRRGEPLPSRRAEAAACLAAAVGISDDIVANVGAAIEIEAAGRIIDVMTGGAFDWRSRVDDSDFLNSADWQCALAYARAAFASSFGDAS